MYEKGLALAREAVRGLSEHIKENADESTLGALFEELSEGQEDDFESAIPSTDPDEAEAFLEGIRNGAQIGLHEVLRETKLDPTDVEEPAARYSGELVCYVWPEGGEYEYRIRVETLKGELLAEANTKRSAIVVSGVLDEDIYSIVGRATLERLAMGLDDTHTDQDLTRYPDVMTLCDGSEDQGIWIATTYAERWEM